VVLPAPFGPTKPQTDPAGLASRTSFTTMRLPKRLVSPVVATASGPAGGSLVRYAVSAITMPERYRRTDSARALELAYHSRA
jgi:hypothetical protein